MGIYLQENHAERQMNDCQVCGQDFESNEELQAHVKVHPEHDKQNFLCAKCGKRYAYTSKYLSVSFPTKLVDDKFKKKNLDSELILFGTFK